MSVFVGKVFKANGCNVKVHIARQVLNKKYGKKIKKTTKIMVHDELGVKVGDTVKVLHCAPISKTKRHKIVEVIS